MTNLLRLVSLSLLLVAACGDDGGDPPIADADGGPGPLPDGAVCPSAIELLPEGYRPVAAVSAGAVTDLGGGRLRIDASAGGAAGLADEPFVYLDLEQSTPDKAALDDEASFDSLNWDVALKRFVIRSNGGTSGRGGVQVAAVDAATLADVTAPPEAAAYAVDDWRGADGCSLATDAVGGPRTALSSWYQVDAGVFTPTDRVFVVETRNHSQVAIEVLSYYADPADAAKSAVYEIAWKRL